MLESTGAIDLSFVGASPPYKRRQEHITPPKRSQEHITPSRQSLLLILDVHGADYLLDVHVTDYLLYPLPPHSPSPSPLPRHTPIPQ